MPTRTIPTQPRNRRLLATAITAATAGAVVGVLATTIATSQGFAPVRPVTTVESRTASLPYSADAAEQWLTPGVRYVAACRADAAQRWQTPDIAVTDLPQTADAAEHWLTPEINVADLPLSADAAEHWLCSP